MKTTCISSGTSMQTWASGVLWHQKHFGDVKLKSGKEHKNARKHIWKADNFWNPYWINGTSKIKFFSPVPGTQDMILALNLRRLYFH